jgi:hypothetical protein
MICKSPTNQDPPLLFWPGFYIVPVAFVGQLIRDRIVIEDIFDAGAEVPHGGKNFAASED